MQVHVLQQQARVELAEFEHGQLFGAQLFDEFAQVLKCGDLLQGGQMCHLLAAAEVVALEGRPP